MSKPPTSHSKRQQDQWRQARFEVFSLGERHPAFGSQPVLLALTLNGEPLGRVGFARLVVRNDSLRGRWVSNHATLEVL